MAILVDSIKTLLPLDIRFLSNACPTLNPHSPIWGVSVLGQLKSCADVTWIEHDLKKSLQVLLSFCSILPHPHKLLHLHLAL